MPIEWAVAGRPLAGERVSGDAHVVQPFPNGVLVAVIDALGHGDQAAATSELASTILRAHAGESVPTLIALCHDGLRAARGAVMSVASINGRNNTVTWAGVGNVEGVLLRANSVMRSVRESLLVRNGVVGFQMPSVRPTVLPLEVNDVLAFATDGIGPGFLETHPAHHPPQRIADDILTRYAKPADDALVLVARYVGRAAP
jgi:phosphoserine phosphatase RsbX